jgi:hypothetical protein
MMVVDLTAQLAPILQGMVVLLALSGTALIAPSLTALAGGALVRLRHKEKRPVVAARTVAAASA